MYKTKNALDNEGHIVKTDSAPGDRKSSSVLQERAESHVSESVNVGPLKEVLLLNVVSIYFGLIQNCKICY